MGKATQGMDFICDIDGTLMNIDHRRLLKPFSFKVLYPCNLRSVVLRY